jgi:hypothetical protein
MTQPNISLYLSTEPHRCEKLQSWKPRLHGHLFTKEIYFIIIIIIIITITIITAFYTTFHTHIQSNGDVTVSLKFYNTWGNQWKGNLWKP